MKPSNTSSRIALSGAAIAALTMAAPLGASTDPPAGARDRLAARPAPRADLIARCVSEAARELCGQCDAARLVDLAHAAHPPTIAGPPVERTCSAPATPRSNAPPPHARATLLTIDLPPPMR